MTDPDFEDFGQILKRHLGRLAAADVACTAAAEARRQVLKAAKEDGVVPSLLKMVAREAAMSPDDREALADYRALLNQPFEATDLATAAQAAQ
jgi:hypothetical protein